MSPGNVTVPRDLEKASIIHIAPSDPMTSIDQQGYQPSNRET